MPNDRERIRRHWREKETEELLRVLREGDHSEYRDITFEIIRDLLEDRDVDLADLPSPEEARQGSGAKPRSGGGSEAINSESGSRRSGLPNCRECDQAVSREAKACPHCGARKPASAIPTWVRHLAQGALIVFVIGYCALPTNRDTDNQAPNRSSSSSAERQNQVRFVQNQVNIRSGRGTEHDVIGSVSPGFPIWVGAERNGWYAVYDTPSPSHGRPTGFVYGNLLTEVPRYEDIERAAEEMTSAQRNAYEDALKGVRIDWTGWIQNVQEQQSILGEETRYQVQVDMLPPGAEGPLEISTQDVVFDVPRRQALNLSREQKVRFLGRIQSLRWLMGGLLIRLENVDLYEAQ